MDVLREKILLDVAAQANCFCHGIRSSCTIVFRDFLRGKGRVTDTIRSYVTEEEEDGISIFEYDSD